MQSNIPDTSDPFEIDFDFDNLEFEEEEVNEPLAVIKANAPHGLGAIVTEGIEHDSTDLQKVMYELDHYRSVDLAKLPVFIDKEPDCCSKIILYVFQHIQERYKEQGCGTAYVVVDFSDEIKRDDLAAIRNRLSAALSRLRKAERQKRAIPMFYFMMTQAFGLSIENGEAVYSDEGQHWLCQFTRFDENSYRHYKSDTERRNSLQGKPQELTAQIKDLF